VTKAAARRGGDDAKRIAAYLAALAPDKRAALERLRKQIKAAAPDAEECISYQMPAFRQGGVILCYAAWKEHCAIYPGGSITKKFAADLAGVDLDKGTIRFTPEKPLPGALVRKIVKARLDEIESGKAKRKSATKGPSAKSAAKNKAASAAATAHAPSTAAKAVRRAKGETDADAFFASLKHPLKNDIAAVRAIILGADKKIAEGVKWASLSFRSADYFATINLRSTDAVQLVFHRGAKSTDGERKMRVADPKGLIQWLSSDRCLVTLGKGPAIAANTAALRAIVKAWVRQI